MPTEEVLNDFPEKYSGTSSTNPRKKALDQFPEEFFEEMLPENLL